MTKNQYLNVRLTAEESAILKSVAHNEGVSVSDLIRSKIREMTGQSDQTEWV